MQKNGCNNLPGVYGYDPPNTGRGIGLTSL